MWPYVVLAPVFKKEEMGLFGVQVVLTMIVASCVHKLSPYYSFGRWFTSTSLVYHTLPPDNELREHINDGGSAKNGRASRSSKDKGSALDEQSVLKRSSNLKLKEVSLNATITKRLYYYAELRWMLDLLVATLVMFLAVIAYFYLSFKSCETQVNLGAAWCGVLLIYTILVLFGVMKLYFVSELAHERTSIAVITMTLFVLGLVVMLLDERYLDFNLSRAHADFISAVNVSLVVLEVPPLEREILEESLPLWGYRFVLVLAGTIMGSTMIFPIINYTRLHYETLVCNDKVVIKTLLQICYITPLLMTTLWIRASSLQGRAKPYTTPDGMMLVRVAVVVGFCLLRIALYRRHLQVYLTRPALWLAKKQSNNEIVKLQHLKSKLSSIFSFYCCCAIQYIGPLVTLLMFSILYVSSNPRYCVWLDSTVMPGHTSSANLPVFDLMLYHAPFSFLLWWTSFVMFVVSSYGTILYTLID